MLQGPVLELSAIRARTLLAVFLLTAILTFGILPLAAPDLFEEDVRLAEALAGVLWYLLLGAFLWHVFGQALTAS